MNFQVPQFIEIEDKIFGPLTLKQGIYVAGGLGVAFSLYVVTGSFIFALILSSPFVALSAALAFYKPGGKSFIGFMESMFWYFSKSRLYVWEKKPEKKQKSLKQAEKEKVSSVSVPKLSDSKLSDLSWSLDIKDKLEDNINNN